MKVKKTKEGWENIWRLRNPIMDKKPKKVRKNKRRLRKWNKVKKLEEG